MSRLTICMISVDFLPNIGGIAAHVHGLSKALVEQGHRVHVLNIRYGSAPDEREEIDGIVVHRLFSRRSPRKIRFLPWLWQGRKYLQSLIASESIDILHWHGLFNDSYLTKWVSSHCARVFTNHSSTYLKMLDDPLKRTYLKWLLGHADLIIAPSEELAFESEMVHSSKRVKYIPNGVDSKTFNPNVKTHNIRALYSIPSDGLTLLCPRRLDPKNGIEYLIESAPRVLRKRGGVYFLIVGDGDAGYREHLKRLTQEAKVSSNVIFAGSVDNADMPGYYADCDAVVLPSLIEATSIAGLEGMACAKPLIGTKAGGIPEIIADGESGLLVDPADSQGLAEATLTLLNDEAKRRSFGLKGRELAVARFDWMTIARRTVELYRSLTEGKK